ncbi:MDR family MFS transporter/patatin-like phospholipase family protein [Paraconexibacter algicola]|uniref:MFS transporter n=1 Tax=Paraconexibacter algicola TaxID=2133960 RepID=A0A2T4UFE6_9ACTN|nr:MDR family MFS transporter/patatin-like phospholipase family protein [Paraconexibacter algicola]PTL56509.1 MFS transporter [Paraconexibacter algicola]
MGTRRDEISTPVGGHARATASAGRVLVVSSLGATLAFVDATVVNVAFPDIARDLGGRDLATVSWVLNAYNIVFAAFLVTAGRVADLLGRRRLFSAGIVLFTGASVLCALAPGLGWLIAARVLQALGAAIVVPASLALVVHAYPAEERAHGVALWSAIAALAAGLGPTIGGLLVELSGWRLVFLVNLPIGALALVLARRTLVENRAPGRRSLPDLAGACWLAAAIALVTLGLVRGEGWGWTDPRTLASFALAAGLLAVVLRRCRWHPSPMLDLDLLRDRTTAIANLLTLVGAAGFYAYVLCNVLFLTAAWDYTVLEAGLALTPGPFVAAAVARPASRVAERLGPGPVLAVGAATWAAGVLLLVEAVGPDPAFVRAWLPAILVLGVGAGITFPVVGATAVAGAPGDRFGSATGLNAVARQLGAVLGVALVVAVLGVPEGAAPDVTPAFDDGWRLAGLCFVATALGAVLLGRAVPLAPAAAPAAAPVTPAVAPRARAPRPAAPAPVAAAPDADDDALAGVGLLADLPADVREQLRPLLRRRLVRAGETVLSQGAPADALLLVASGRLDVVKDGQPAGAVGRGAVLGELGLLTGAPRSATVVARRDSELLELPRAAFLALLDRERSVERALLRTLAAQVAALPAAPAPASPARSGTLAVVERHPTGLHDALLDAVAHELTGHGPVARLGPRDGGTDPRARLDALERTHGTVVLAVPHDAPEAWRTFVTRHADRTVLLVDADRDPDPADARTAGAGHLVLVDAAPGGAATRWRAAHPGWAHHHVRRADRSGTLGRAARRIAGTSVGLVLSGGGARALAHIGVLETLAAHGVVVDRVGGCSFGAFVGALLADGRGPAEIDAVCFEEFVRRRPASDYTLPRVALARGRRLRALGDRLLPGLVEDLPLSFFCNSADLQSGELRIHRDGPVADALLASSAVPGLLPPVASHGRLLVDGGVLSNLPVLEMRRSGEGPVIAVDVSSRFDPSTARPRTTRPRRGRAPEDADTLPAIGDTLTSGLLLGSVAELEANRRAADLLIEPRPDGVGLLEFHQLDRAIAAGREAAERALAAAPPPGR